MHNNTKIAEMQPPGKKENSDHGKITTRYHRRKWKKATFYLCAFLQKSSVGLNSSLFFSPKSQAIGMFTNLHGSDYHLFFMVIIRFKWLHEFSVFMSCYVKVHPLKTNFFYSLEMWMYLVSECGAVVHPHPFSNIPAFLCFHEWRTLILYGLRYALKVCMAG